MFKDNHYKVIISSGEHRHVRYKSYKIQYETIEITRVIPFFKFRVIRKKTIILEKRS